MVEGGAAEPEPDESAQNQQAKLDPQWVGALPDGTSIGICVDKSGLALIDTETEAVAESFDLFHIRGWGASDTQLQVVIDRGGDGEDVLSVETHDGAEIVEVLRNFAEELAAVQP